MATTRLHDQDRLDGASNYGIWKARMTFFLDEFGQKTYAENVVAIPTDQQRLVNYNKEMAKAKRIILDGFRDHIIPHAADKNKLVNVGCHHKALS